nr:unnamed protein product [Digitaria exilis]
MGRSPCCDESGLKKGPWTPEEDEKLLQYIRKNGHGSWRTLPRLAGTQSAPSRLIQMGFDPMTHRPRTDFFAALPQLIALAALRDQLAAGDPSPAANVQLHAGDFAGVDVAIQAAKLQYLQCLLQSAAATIASTAAAPDAEAAAMVLAGDLCSPEGTRDSAAPVSMAGGQLLSCTFTDQVAAVSSEEGNQELSFGADVDMFACHGGGGGSLPPLTDVSDAGNNAGDGCSATASSSFGVGGGESSPLPWPEFFPDDPFITDFL